MKSRNYFSSQANWHRGTSFCGLTRRGFAIHIICGGMDLVLDIISKVIQTIYSLRKFSETFVKMYRRFFEPVSFKHEEWGPPIWNCISVFNGNPEIKLKGKIIRFLCAKPKFMRNYMKLWTTHNQPIVVETFNLKEYFLNIYTKFQGICWYVLLFYWNLKSVQ